MAAWLPPLVSHLGPEIAAGAGTMAPTVPAEMLTRGVLAWVSLFGLVSFELFGHLVGSVEHPELLFEQFLEDSAVALGFGSGRRTAAGS